MNEKSREMVEKRRELALRLIAKEAREKIRRVKEYKTCDCGWCKEMDRLANIAEEALL